MKDEALDLALYALELEDMACRYEKESTPEHIAKAITAIKQARSAPVQEPVAQAWDEGYRAGINDERMSEANIGIAGFGAKVDPARNNPYRTTPPAAPVQEHQINQLEKFKNHVLANADALGVVLDVPAAPVQEDWGPGPHEYHSLTAAPVQEPVAWISHNAGLYHFKPDESLDPLPLYLAPPAAQRQWVGLTDDERNHARQTVTYSQIAMTASEWTEAVQIETEKRLKEKNT